MWKELNSGPLGQESETAALVHISVLKNLYPNVHVTFITPSKGSGMSQKWPITQGEFEDDLGCVFVVRWGMPYTKTHSNRQRAYCFSYADDLFYMVPKVTLRVFYLIADCEHKHTLKRLCPICPEYCFGRGQLLQWSPVSPELSRLAEAFGPGLALPPAGLAPRQSLRYIPSTPCV